jgi:hypothetical protein
MSQTKLSGAGDVLDGAATTFASGLPPFASKIPGYLAGVYHDGDQTVVAQGVANVVTGRQCATPPDSCLDPSRNC